MWAGWGFAKFEIILWTIKVVARNQIVGENTFPVWQIGKAPNTTTRFLSFQRDRWEFEEQTVDTEDDSKLLFQRFTKAFENMRSATAAAAATSATLRIHSEKVARKIETLCA